MMRKIITSLIHPDLRDINNPEHKKSYAATYTILLFFASYVPYVLYFSIKYPEDKTKLILNFLGIPLFGLIFLTLRFLKNINLTLGILNNLSYLLIFSSIYTTGGIYSADLAWVILCVLSAFIIVNNRWGIISMCFAIIGLILLYVVELINPSDNIFKKYVLYHDSTHYAFTWSFVIILLAIILYSVNNIIEKSNQTIKQMNIDRISDLEVKLKTKTEEIAEMRSNIAKDFHDEMGNKLASINILSQSIALQLQNENSDVLNLLKTIEKRSKELYDGTKDFIWSIDVRNDNIYELFIYTRDFGERFLNPLGISCVAKCDFTSNTTKRLHSNTTRQYIYIMKEVFTNAVKHSNCSEIHINFTTENNKLSISIKDNGEGFSENHKLGNGISNINQRVNNVSSEMKFSTTKSGTEYVFLFPIE